MRQRFSLREVYLNFVPVCRPHENTCVGLALELMRRWTCLEERFPGLGAATGLLSCEETAPHVLRDTHMTQGPHELIAPDKEHVMVGVQISFNGRRGVLIADPGYHVERVSEEVMMEITIFNAQLNFPEGRLLSIIYQLVKILSDEPFVRQCIELNSYITQCSVWQRDYLWSLQSDAVKQEYQDEL